MRPGASTPGSGGVSLSTSISLPSISGSWTESFGALAFQDSTITNSGGAVLPITSGTESSVIDLGESKVGGGSTSGSASGAGQELIRGSIMAQPANEARAGGAPQRQRQRQRQRTGNATSADSVGSAHSHSHHSAAPSSPPHNVLQFSASATSGSGAALSAPSAPKNISRPPGLGPLNAGKPEPGHSKQSSSSTAPSLTLTPASSVDGTADLYQSMSISGSGPGAAGGRYSNAHYYNEGPSLPTLRQAEYSRRAHLSNTNTNPGVAGSDGDDDDDDDRHAELPKGITTFGSFDSSLDGTEGNNDNDHDNDNDNDGLLGLSALRDRAHSSPGPVTVNTFSSSSSSPPTRSQQMGMGHASFHDEGSSNRSTSSDHRRPRTASRDGGRPSLSSRPPLSGGLGAPSPHMDGSAFSSERAAAAFSGSRSRDPSPPPSYPSDSSVEYRGTGSGPGIISRPDVRSSSASDFTDLVASEASSLRRSTSTDTGREFVQNMFSNNPTTQGDHHRTHSSSSIDQQHPFSHLQQQQQQQQKMTATPPPHSSHHQQRSHGGQSAYPSSSAFPGNPHSIQRHQRSFSQPGPVRSSNQDYQPPQDDALHRRKSEYSSNRLPPGMEGEYSYGSMPPPAPHQQQTSAGRHHRIPSGDGSASSASNFAYGAHNRSMSLNQTPQSADSNQHQRRSSLQYHSGNPQQYGGSATLNRRDPMDFAQPYHNRSDSAPVMASSDEMRLYADAERLNLGGGSGGGFMRQHERMVSPAHSPMHSTYSGGHSRHPSDMGSSVGMSSSPMSLGSSGVRGGMHGLGHDPYGMNPSRIGHRRGMPSEDDMSRSLLGEHIEVPSDEQYGGGMIHSSVRHPHTGMEPLPPQGYYSPHDTSRHLPTAGSTHPQPKIVYNVKFKRTQRSFVLGPRINRDLKIGTYIKVEADRGEDLGIVVGKIPSEKYNTPNRSSFRGSGPGEMSIIPPPTGLGTTNISDLKRIIRLATHDEVSLLTMKREEEEELLKICRTKVRQRGLPMNVVDAEYQFDRHKLTFFFEAEGRVDFRELVRDLFSMYKTRIWMQQLDKTQHTLGPIPVPPPPPVMIDYGTPIIAPASEYTD